MPKWAQGVFTPKNPEKYIGKKKPRYRSGWELNFMMFCDNHKSVLQWASESLTIPYRHPFTGKPTIYVPDFFVLYETKMGQKKAEIVEIKPKNQTLFESKGQNARLKQTVAINHAKWAACAAWCKKNNLTFRVLNEDDIFRQGKR